MSECQWFILTAFLGTADIGVHIVHISRVIIAYTLESLSSLTYNHEIATKYVSISPQQNVVATASTHCGLVTPFGDIDLGQHWLREWLGAWRHQAITQTKVDLS